jgi:hypothetical protein
MIQRLLGLTLLFNLAGCATGSVVQLPEVRDPARVATVVIVRPWAYVGGGSTQTITVDAVETHELGNDEHVVIAVDPGERLIGMKTWDPNVCCFVRIHPTQTIQAEAGRTYFFRITPGRIERATEADGRALVEKTTPLQEWVP